MVVLMLATIVCLGLIYLGLRGQSPPVLREFRTKLRGYADLLVYGAVIDDGIVLNKDGALMAGWEYRGNDLDSASEFELDALSERVNAALKRRGSGWMMHVDAIRRDATTYPNAGSFPDRTTSLIDDERRLQYEAEGAHFETHFVLVLTYLAPADNERSFERFLVAGENSETEPSASQALHVFRAALHDFENNIAANLRLRRLKSHEAKSVHGSYRVDDFLSHINFCLTAQDHRVRLPSTPMYLDAVLGGIDFYGGLKPRVGHAHVRCISITGFPNESYPGVLAQLNGLAMPYRWSNRFLFLDPPEAHKRIESYRKKWFMKRKSFKGYLAEQTGAGSSGPISGDADIMTNDAQAALDDLSGDVVRFGFYTSVIVITDEDAALADERAREVLKLLFNLGFNAQVEDINAVEAFLGTHPGNGYANIRKPLVHTRNVADFIPLTAVWAGAPKNPCPFYPADSPPLAYTATSGATPFRLNLHVGDVGHTMVLGPTGAGKSTFLNFCIASHFRYAGAQVFAFDKGYSAYALVNAAGGRHYDIMGEFGSPAFCPLARIDDPAEHAWAAEWLETLVALQGITVTPNYRRAIFHALSLLAQNESRTMTDLLNGPLQEPVLRAALDRYTLDGPLGTLLDSRNDSLADDAFTVFELEHLMESGVASQRNIVPVLLYLFHRLEQRLDGRPTLIVLDEAWTLIDNSLFAEKIRDWLKTLRKKNAAVIFATQSVSDVLGKPITSAILESCPTKIFLPNPEARSQTSSEAYKTIGLTDRQIEILSFAIPKRHYYYVSPLGQRLFDLGLGPVAISFAGVGGKDDIATIRGLIRRLGADWPAEWLWSRGQFGAAARWLGGAASCDAAYAVLDTYRQTWPAEWLHRHGRDEEANQWLTSFALPDGESLGFVAAK